MLFNTVQGPFPPAFGMQKTGKLKTVDSWHSSAKHLSVGFETLDRELFDPEPCYELLGESGVKFARCQSGWSLCEQSPGKYVFDWLDRVVNRFLELGIQPWLGLTFGNKLYSPDAKHPSAVGCPPICYGEKAVEAWKNFIREVVRRYRGKVTHFEVWNEPDNRQFWGPGAPDPAQYVELVRITSSVIRAENPEAKIIGGAFADVQAAEECLKLGMGEFCDIVSYHSYTMYPEFYAKMFADFMRECVRRHAPHLKIWHGESGCPSQSGDHYDEWIRLFRSDEEVQAKWLARRIATDFRNGLDMFSYYHTSDLTLKPYVNGDGVPTKAGRMGLLAAPEVKPKMSYRVLQHFCALFDDSLKTCPLRSMVAYDNVYDPCLAPERPRDGFTNIIVDSCTREGYPFYLYYYPGDLQRSQTLSAALGNTFQAVAENSIAEPVLADTVSGMVYSFSRFALKDGKLFLQRIPLTDYPLILTDRKALKL